MLDGCRLHVALLPWADAARRDLPWRRTRDPWAILVSETMLQQTQVSRVVPRYRAFLDVFPTVQACAEAPVAAVIDQWAGLGYNRRAVGLHAAATLVVRDHRGVVPATIDELLALPGVGPYTARAVLVFSGGQDLGVVDTNVGRILARWSGVSLTPSDAQRLADELVPPGRSWAWNQGLFDLGASVCTKRSPRCDECPVRSGCSWQGSGPDPASGSAATSSSQTRFEGSFRQGRGRLVTALRSGSVAPEDVAEVVGWDDRERVQQCVESLIADGLVQRDSRNRLVLGSRGIQ